MAIRPFDTSDFEETILNLSTSIESKIASLSSSSSQSHLKDTPPSDWTKVYSFWDKYSDEDNSSIVKPTDTPDDAAGSNLKFDKEDLASTLGHNHDHSNERQLFVKPESEKFQLCEDNYLIAKQLYNEGNWISSIEHYKLSLSYFEYCFPDEINLQERLSFIRIESMCSLGSCYNNQGSYSEATEILTRLLNEKPGNILALLRRSQAYRNRDLYDKAREDLRAAKAIDPLHPLIIYEMERLNTRELNSFAAEKEMFRDVLNGGNIARKARIGGSHISIHALSGDEVAAFDITAPLEPNVSNVDMFLKM